MLGLICKLNHWEHGWMDGWMSVTAIENLGKLKIKRRKANDKKRSQRKKEMLKDTFLSHFLFNKNNGLIAFLYLKL